MSARPVSARPSVVAAVAVGDRLRAGLAEEWKQRALTPQHPLVGGADLLLVELADGRVPGFDDPAPLVAAAARDGVPLLVWVTSGRPAVHPVLEAADAVFVAEDLAAWRAVVPEARLLPPAAGPRVHGPTAPAERRTGGAVVVSSGPTDPGLAGPVAAVLARGVRPLGDAVVTHLLDDRIPARGVLPAPLVERLRPGTYADSVAAVREARVLLDGPRRSPGDTWAVLEAAIAQTPALPVDGTRDPAAYRSEVVARLHQPELADREGLRAQRAALAGHTYGHRVPELLAAAGLDDPAPVPGAGTVSAIVPTNREHEIDNVLANLGRQVHDETELVLVLHGLDLPEAELRARAADAGVRHLTVRTADHTLTLGACLNLGIDAAEGRWIAKMDDDNLYGAHYLTDLVGAFATSGAGIVGKWAHYVWLRATGAVVLRYPHAEHTWERRIQGGSMLFDGDVARGLRFGDLPRAVDSDVLDRAIADGVRIWSADRFNYVSVRGDDRGAHTWTVADTTFLTATGRLVFHGDPRPHVEV